MKRLYFLLLAFMGFTGCDKVTPTEPDEHAVPDVVIKAIVEQFSNTNSTGSKQLICS